MQGHYNYYYFILHSHPLHAHTHTHTHTANSFMSLVRYMFSLPEVKTNQLAFLSQNLCQDPLEKFFGCQRQRGGTSDNPNVQEFFKNSGALRVVNSFCRTPSKGNCRGTMEHLNAKVCMLTEKENTPLPKASTPRVKAPKLPTST